MSGYMPVPRCTLRRSRGARAGRIAFAALILALVFALAAPGLAAAANNAGGAPASSGLAAPVLRVEPVEGVDDLSQLVWSTQFPATGYEVQCALDDLFRPNKLVGSAGLDAGISEYRFGGLKVGTTYFYRVRAVSGSTKGPWSNIVFFVHGQRHTGSNPPIAVAGADYHTFVGVPVTLDASLSHDPDGTIVKYEWDFDADGTWDATTTGPTVSHAFDKPGNRRVLLRVTDHSGLTATDRTHVMVRMDAFPPVAVIAGPSEVYVGEPAFFDGSLSYDDEGFITTYSWSFIGDDEYEFSSLLPTVAYTFLVPGEWVVRLDVRDAVGNVGTAQMSVLVKVRDHVAPAVVQNVRAFDTPDDEGGSITVEWDANSESDLLGYHVYRSESADGPFALVGTSVGTSFVDVGVTDGVEYFYVVTAYDALEFESDPSAVVSAIAADNLAPEPPTGLSAVPVASGGAVDLAWTASISADVAGYRVYRDGAQIADQPGTTYSDTGLAEGAVHVYSVRAYDGAGNLSDAALADSVTVTTTSPPATPTGVTAVDVPGDGGGAIEVSWDANTDHAVGYIVDVYEGIVLVRSEDVGDATSHVFSGLTDGVEYGIAVSAYDAFDRESAPSALVYVTPMDNTAPDAPQDVVVTNRGARSIALGWSAVGSGAGIEYYEVERSDDDGENWVIVGAVPGVEFVDQSCAPSTTYVYRVRAFDMAGQASEYSDPVTATTKVNPVDAVKRYENTDPSVVYVGDWYLRSDGAYGTHTSGGSIHTGMAGSTYAELEFYGSQVTWIGLRAPNRGIAHVYIDGEFVAAVDCYRSTWHAVESWQVPLFAHDFGTPGSHQIRVYHTGLKNESSANTLIEIDAFDVVAPDEAPPTIPTGLIAQRVLPTQANLTWTASSDNVAVAGYRIQRSTDNGPWVDLAVVPAPGYTDGSLEFGSTYRYRVSAFDASENESEFTGPVSASGSGVYRYENTHESVVYVGEWVLRSDGAYGTHTSAGSLHTGSSAATYASLEFYGSQVTWIGLRAPNRGIANVYIDGEFAGEVDCYWPSWDGTNSWQARLFSRDFGEPGFHEIRVYYTGTKNSLSGAAVIDVDAFEVESSW